MNHVPKQQWMGCAVASAAMLAGRSYEVVAAHWPDLDEARSRRPQEMCALLEAVTEVEWRFSPCWHPQPAVLRLASLSWPVAVFIRDAELRPRFGQWIVLTDGVVHDPGEPIAYDAVAYPRRDWVVQYVAQPARPHEFARSRAQGQASPYA